MPLIEDLFLVVGSHLTSVLVFDSIQLVGGTFALILTSADRDSQFAARLGCRLFSDTRS